MEDSIEGPAKHYVYTLARPSTGEVFYVGYGQGRRMFAHESFARIGMHVNKHVENIIKQEGGSVIKEKICEGLTLRQASILETKLIRLYGRRIDGSGILANIEPGADGDVKVTSIETRAKMSASAKGKIIKPESVAKGIKTYRENKKLDERDAQACELFIKTGDAAEVARVMNIALHKVRKIISKNKLGTRIREQKHNKAWALYNEGKPINEIVKEVGLSESQITVVVRKRKKETGVYEPDTTDYEARDKLILSRVATGKKYSVIARELGLSYAIVLHTVQRKGNNKAA